MKESSNSEEEKVKLPWEDELAVRDLIKPITVRRLKLLQVAGATLFFLALALFAYLEFIKPPSGEWIVRKMIKEAGGLDEWNSIKDGSFVRTHHLYDETGKIIKQSEETFYFLNNPEGQKFMIKSITDEGEKVVIGRDKTGFWASLNETPVNPVTIAKDMEFMCGDDGCSPLCASEMALYRMSFPFKLADPGVRPRNAGTATLNGEKVMLLEITFDPKVGYDRWIFYVDPATKLMRKIEHYPTLKDNVQPEEIFLSDFKKAGNIMLSHTNKYYRSNGKILEEYLISDVKFNSAIGNDFFKRPQQNSVVSSK